MKKFGKLLTATFLLTFSMTITAFAGTWKQDNAGWWWQNDDGTYPKSTWQWIDDDGDGTAESYCFDANGYVYTNTTTPDGYTVNGDGAWVENGVVKQSPAETPAAVITPAVTPGVFQPATDADKQLLLDSINKTNGLSSMAAKSNVNMTMSMDGETVPVTMDLDMKFKNLNTNDMKYLVNTHINMMGVDISGDMFYTNGYYYVDMAGQKQKTAMDLSTVMNQVASNTNSRGLSSLDAYQNLQTTVDENGFKVYTFTSDPSQMSSYINNVYNQMGLSATQANIRALNGSIYLTSDGYCAAQSMNLIMDVSVSGQTATADMKMNIYYINPGQPVDFELPSTDGFVEVSQ